MLRFSWFSTAVSTAALAAFWTISPALVGSAIGQTAGQSAPLGASKIATAPAQSPSDAAPGTVRPIDVPKLDIVIPIEPPPSLGPKSEPKVEAVPEKPKPGLSLATEITERLKRDRVSGGEREDQTAAAKIYDQRQGEPIWLTPKGFAKEATELMREIGQADDWGLRASDFRLPNATLSSNASPAEMADADVTLSLAALKYARHARGGRLDPAQLSKNFDRRPQVYAPESVLAELARAAHPDTYLRSLHPSHPQFGRLRQKYLAARAGQSVQERAPEPVQVLDTDPRAKRKQPVPASPQPLSAANMQKKLLANMEMWRWMPDVGETYIQNNIPEFTTRMIRGGKVVHQERIVTGKAETQTPIFSGEMQTVVFQPFWNVPESIKWKELQPQLMRSGYALDKAGLKAAYNGREVDPTTVDWATADMRAFHIFQPPGNANALGQVKFLFPNKHDVYMHDTPSKSLFNQNVRTFSHGCMRVRDPLKFAEMLLADDPSWNPSRIAQMANTGPQNNEVRLKRKIPIHVTYFTTWVDDDGKLKTFSDIYGHENRIQLGLDGKAHLIAQPKEEKFAPPGGRPNGPGVRFVQKSSPVENWIKNIFNF